jgi:hypothetical protein
MIKNKEARIESEEETSPYKPTRVTKLNKNSFVRIKDLSEEIHIDQTGAFPYTSQRGNRYIMVAIHLDKNYISVKPMKNRSEAEFIHAYQKIINRMKIA